jgi:hypothetical protein
MVLPQTGRYVAAPRVQLYNHSYTVSSWLSSEKSASIEKALPVRKKWILKNCQTASDKKKYGASWSIPICRVSCSWPSFNRQHSCRTLNPAYSHNTEDASSALRQRTNETRRMCSPLNWTTTLCRIWLKLTSNLQQKIAVPGGLIRRNNPFSEREIRPDTY